MKDWILLNKLVELEGKTIKRTARCCSTYILLEFPNDEVAIFENDFEDDEVYLVENLRFLPVSSKVELGLMSEEEAKERRIKNSIEQKEKQKEAELREFNRLKEKYKL